MRGYRPHQQYKLYAVILTMILPMEPVQPGSLPVQPNRFTAAVEIFDTPILIAKLGQTSAIMGLHRTPDLLQ